jgi:hypothetical protein
MKSLIVWAILLILFASGYYVLASQVNNGNYMGSFGGGCCGSSSNSADETEQLAADYYMSKTGANANDFSIKINDYGCHQEAEIIQDGKIVMELSISGGTVSEI